ncbi:F-box/LRR-repeat protein 3-like [Miscanthus floridulus]|uniref:F-box/LRR-repeat protein 3-like n=1 Tax=Miscanthus floridulus TaxID=154761 RepID=UPI00345AE020
MPAAYIPVEEKNISLVLSTSARDAASGFSLASLSPVASAAPPSAVASAARRRRHRRAPPPPLLPAERHLGLGGRPPARRHADLGFRRGTGLGPGSAAHRRGWPARGGGVPRTRRGGFGAAGVAALAPSCPGLADLDLSNGVDLGDAAAAEVARVKGLQRLSLARWKLLSDMGVGYVDVGCAELRELSLKWCLGVSDLGIQLLALKCRKLTRLDLSYTMITKDSFPAIMKLPNLQQLTLVGGIGIDDDALGSLDKECSKSLHVLDMSQCQNITDVGVSSMLKSVPNLLELDLSYCCPVTPSMVRSLQKIPKLRTLKLEGCKFMTDGLKAIGTSCVSLRQLSLSKCSGVTDTELNVLNLLFFFLLHIGSNR